MMELESSAATDEPDDAVEVLYLEDDPDMAQLYELKLQMDGYHVHTVPLESTPPAVMTTPLPELLFVDMRLRARVAWESLAAWRRDRRLRGAPAVILSNLDAAALEQRGVHLGPLDQVLMRPILTELH